VISVGALTWAPEFLNLKLHLSIVDAGRVIALYGVMSAAASFASAATARRLGDRGTILFSLILSILLVAIFGIATNPAEAVLLAAGLGWMGMLYFAPLFALVPYATKQGPAAAGVAFGIFNSVSNVGSFVAPVFMGYILDRTASFGITFAAVGLLGTIGIVGGLMIQGRSGHVPVPGTERPTSSSDG
jgi:predicted MFS family arabinose efflux permease